MMHWISYMMYIGKGLHSDGHVAKIKPALEELMRQYVVLASPDFSAC
jgi:hypothetical protein